jgi:hypothetical protein
MGSLPHWTGGHSQRNPAWWKKVDGGEPSGLGLLYIAAPSTSVGGVVVFYGTHPDMA